MSRRLDVLYFAFLGVAIVLFALHNALIVPASASDFEWLTTDSEIIEFIGWNFRMQGLWQIPLGLLLIATALTAYQHGERWAWLAFCYLPLHFVLLGVVMPWLLPLFGGLAAVALLALRHGRPKRTQAAAF